MQKTRRTLILLNSFLAVTAIAGGYGLMSGDARPPAEMLSGSLFHDYTIPALVLALAVGGTAIAATILLIRSDHRSRNASMLSAVCIILFESVEVAVIGSPEGIARNLQMFYFLLGGIIAVLSFVYTTENVPHAS